MWSPLPCISWFLPFIGHTGICKLDGKIHDFAGPYTIGIDDFAFMEAHKYVVLDVSDEELARFDAMVEKADKTYRRRMHNICCDNCHSHVACALNNF